MIERVPTLVALEGPAQGGRYAVHIDGLTIGRDSTCGVILQDDSVSRQHARLVLQNGSVWIQDFGSRNGVFVNDKRLVRPSEVSPGDKVRVGVQLFILEVETIERDVTETRPVPGFDPRAATQGSAHRVAPRRTWAVLALGVIVAMLGLGSAILVWWVGA